MGLTSTGFVNEVVTVRMQFSGQTPSAGYKVQLVLPTGVTFTTATPNCVSLFNFQDVSNCAFSGNTFSFELTDVRASGSTISIDVDSFQNPSTALDAWPAGVGDGFNATLLDAGGYLGGSLPF